MTGYILFIIGRSERDGERLLLVPKFWFSSPLEATCAGKMCVCACVCFIHCSIEDSLCSSLELEFDQLIADTTYFTIDGGLSKLSSTHTHKNNACALTHACTHTKSLQNLWLPQLKETYNSDVSKLCYKLLCKH